MSVIVPPTPASKPRKWAYFFAGILCLCTLVALWTTAARVKAAKLAALRQRRDNERVQQALTALERGAAGSDNLMPLIIDAVEAYATLGEVSDAMRRVFGEQREFRSME